MKKILSLMLAFVMIISIGTSTSVFASTLPEKNSVSFFLSDEIINSLDDEIESNETMRKQDSLLQFYNNLTSKGYDKSLGGAYFDDNGDLNIVIKEGIHDFVKTSQEGIKYVMGKYSYAELEKFQDTVNHISDDINLDGTGIDQEDNKIIIYTDDEIKLNKELLLSLIPDDSVKIVIEDNKTVNDAIETVKPGTKISNTSASTAGSVGCGVIWDNSTSSSKKGFVTAGHVGAVGDSISYNGSSMGTITKKQESGTVDAALIKNGQTSNTFNYSNKVPDNKTFNYNGGTFPKNTQVYAYGAYTSSTMSGKITDTSYSGTFDGIKFTKLIRTDITTSTSGNSGGPVITSYSDSYSIIGIIKGRVSGDLVYTNMQEIKDAFDLNVLNP